jgi:bifunctional non-homologous end joining protein LigD
MTPLVPELTAQTGTFDGELVKTTARSTSPCCANACSCAQRNVVTFVVFDVLSLDGRDLTRAPYSERRAQLEALHLNGVYWQAETFDDGHALFEAVCAHVLEGVVAKRRSGPYRPASASG